MAAFDITVALAMVAVGALGYLFILVHRRVTEWQQRLKNEMSSRLITEEYLRTVILELHSERSKSKRTEPDRVVAGIDGEGELIFEDDNAAQTESA